MLLLLILKVLIKTEENHVFVLVTPFPVIAFTNEEATCCINEEAIGPINEAAEVAIIAPRNPPSCFYILCFTVSVAPSINKPESCSDFTILIMSPICSFEMNKVNFFPALTSPCPLIFTQIYLI